MKTAAGSKAHFLNPLLAYEGVCSLYTAILRHSKQSSKVQKTTVNKLNYTFIQILAIFNKRIVKYILILIMY